ncbi:unnamed protein product [Cuscuta campestris]|uniref:Uncharacterized protein n=1 Tax=Cuscuta campestris TaxID=132261 RepID=A0A484M7T8_9ASTE|nr:unnamed protein product [Cuscuta campestris]
MHLHGTGSYPNSCLIKPCWCALLKNLGKTNCLMGTSNMIIRGNNTPAMGIHVIPKHATRYAAWNMVKTVIVLKGTDSINVAAVRSAPRIDCLASFRLP